eukprot:INCI2713.3.p1 GENE.INCI2713.3~~INCI2713.3.p1  ORF type:complete len:1163 (-),score=196.53 INCI2713.3:1223-4711(-)
MPTIDTTAESVPLPAGAEPDPVFALVGDELHFTPTETGWRDAGSSPSSPETPSGARGPSHSRKIKRYKLDDIVGIRFEFDQENIKEYFMNITIVKKSNDHLDFRVYLGVVWSALLVLMSIRGIYLCCGPVTALVFVGYLIVYARKKMSAIALQERELELESEQLDTPSQPQKSANVTGLDSEKHSSLEEQDPGLLPHLLPVYAIGSWVFGASLEAVLFARFDVEDSRTPVLFLRTIVVLFMLGACFAVHFTHQRIVSWYRERGYLFRPPTEAAPAATPARSSGDGLRRGAASPNKFEDDDASKTMPDPSTSPLATGKQDKNRFGSELVARLATRPTTDGKVVKEDLDMLRKKLHFPDVIQVREHHFSTYLHTRLRIVEWSRRRREQSKFGVFILPRWGEYFLHLLPQQYYNSTTLRRRVQWVLDFLFPALFIVQIFGFVSQPLAGLYKSLTQRTQTDIFLNLSVNALSWASRRFVAFFAWFSSAERIALLMNFLQWVAEWVFFFFSKVKEPLVWIDTRFVYVRQKTLGMRTFFAHIASIFGPIFNALNYVRTTCIGFVVAWTQRANRVGAMGLGKKFTDIFNLLRRRLEVFLWDREPLPSPMSTADAPTPAAGTQSSACEGGVTASSAAAAVAASSSDLTSAPRNPGSSREPLLQNLDDVVGPPRRSILPKDLDRDFVALANEKLSAEKAARRSRPKKSQCRQQRHADTAIDLDRRLSIICREIQRSSFQGSCVAHQDDSEAKAPAKAQKDARFFRVIANFRIHCDTLVNTASIVSADPTHSGAPINPQSDTTQSATDCGMQDGSAGPGDSTPANRDSSEVGQLVRHWCSEMKASGIELTRLRAQEEIISSDDEKETAAGLPRLRPVHCDDSAAEYGSGEDSDDDSMMALGRNPSGTDAAPVFFPATDMQDSFFGTHAGHRGDSDSSEEARSPSRRLSALDTLLLSGGSKAVSPVALANEGFELDKLEGFELNGNFKHPNPQFPEAALHQSLEDVTSSHHVTAKTYTSPLPIHQQPGMGSGQDSELPQDPSSAQGAQSNPMGHEKLFEGENAACLLAFPTSLPTSDDLTTEYDQHDTAQVPLRGNAGANISERRANTPDVPGLMHDNDTHTEPINRGNNADCDDMRALATTDSSSKTGDILDQRAGQTGLRKRRTAGAPAND